MTIDLANKRICVTGGAGFLGRAVCATLGARGCDAVFVPRSCEYDLTQPGDVAYLLDRSRLDILIHLAAECGGIGANEKQPGRFFYANMAMGLNMIEEARRRGVEKFVQVGTVCSYPRHCEIPFREENLWNGYPEETNAPYGIAKRALGVMIEAYRKQYGFNGINLILANLYGPGDNFDPETSHVIPAMIRRFCEAVENGDDTVKCWGSGGATREFLYVDDAAEAIVRATEMYDDSEPLNIGSGDEGKISSFAGAIERLCGFAGRTNWDTSRPDGQPRRKLDTMRACSLLKWHAQTRLEEGLRRTIAWWRENALTEVPT